MKKIPLLLTLFLFVGSVKKLYAQNDSVTAVINSLRSIQEDKHFDTSLFKRRADTLASLVLQENEIAVLNKLATGFDKGDNLDLDLYIRYRILISLSKSDLYRAIDYAKQNLGLFAKNKGANRELLQISFISQLRIPYRNSDRIGEGFLYFNDLLAKSKAIGDKTATSIAYYVLSGFYRTIGLYDVAIYHMLKARALTDSSDHNQLRFLSIVGTNKGISAWVNNTGVLGEYYLLKGNFDSSLAYSRLAYVTSLYAHVENNQSYVLKNMAIAQMQLNKPDSAAVYLDSALTKVGKFDFISIPLIMQAKSLLYIKTGETVKAEEILAKCWEMIHEKKFLPITPGGVLSPDYYLALTKIAQHKLPEAAVLLTSDLERIKGIRMDMLRDYRLLGETYDAMGNQQKAKELFAKYISMQDSLLSDQSRFRILSFETEEQIATNEQSIFQLKKDNRISRILWILSLGIVLLLLVLASLIYQRYRVKQKANNALEKTLADLKNTQKQLVQSEKMASLGELTAGIAHEIQNPLNFVNNFSDVNKELLTEMKEEMDKGNIDGAKEIANDVIANEEKINFHGKRADAIVKGMLQHSRSSSGQKEPTNINTLADEYLRLAYHGLRAKDKSFNATLKTNFDETIGSINIIPQDMGRVILNLITNAFYVVDEKKKALAEKSSFENLTSRYEPTVSVSTKKTGDKVLISVKDNGNGVPQSVIEKIFQPFFTTKPTGQGTGLGLSMSYDIVTKGHGGELKAVTKDGEGAEFIIILPI